MTQRTTYDLVSEPSGVELAKLLGWALNVAPQLGLVVHSDRVRLSSRAIAFLEQVEPFLIATTEVSEWPGTRLIGERHGILRCYRLTPESIEILAGTADRLYQWVNPDLPEDPHLLRGDGSVLLGTVTQEADAWMELSGDELDSLIREVPWMSGTLRQRR